MGAREATQSGNNYGSVLNCDFVLGMLEEACTSFVG